MWISAGTKRLSSPSSPERYNHNEENEKRMRLDYLLEDTYLDFNEIDVSYENAADLQSSQYDLVNARDSNSTIDTNPFDEYTEQPQSSSESDIDSVDATICFGMIPNVQIRFLGDRQRSRLFAFLSNSFGCCALSLVFSDNQCCLVLPHHVNAESIAKLNQEDCGKLAKLTKDFACHYDGIFVQHILVPQEYSLNVSIGINVYGSRSTKDTIADAIYSKNYFLQDPVWRPDNVPYENPQCLELADLGGDHVYSIDFDAVALDPFRLAIESSKYSRSYGFDYDNMLNDFARHDYLSEAAVDSRICTMLKSYQREGLDFILKRESGDIPAERKLWISEGYEDDKPIYRHIISGATSHEGQEATGGILADEMGLGKSLTMLSAIIASLGAASTYAQSKTMFDQDPQQSVIAARSTLVVVPSSLLIDNWIEQIQEHVLDGQLSYYKYHGHRRKIDWCNLLKNDIVFTTYGTVAQMNRTETLLFKPVWYRVVLDEAHTIRNSSTNTFKAIQSLKSAIRWCMTGTPIQNNIDDLGSLLKFLRTPVLEDAAQFNRCIANMNLHTLLRSICLRRNTTVLPMSKANEETCTIPFTDNEQDEYNRMSQLSLDQLDAAVDRRDAKQSHMTVLEAILRLRLFCSNGIIKRSAWIGNVLQDTDIDTMFALLQQNNSAHCEYCRNDVLSVSSQNDPESAKMTGCHRLVCGECLDRYGHGFKGDVCPLCKSQHGAVDAVESHATPLSNLEIDSSRSTPTNAEYSTKLKALCENIKTCIYSEKSIVFSFWQTTLNVVCKMFEEQRIPFMRLDGDVPHNYRKQIIKDFQNSPMGTVLLMTVGIGAVGLNNLTVASQIHILEPQWNPSVESQAIGRVVRLGQQRPVRIIRYVVDRSVESSVRDRQHQKLRLSSGGFSNIGEQHGISQHMTQALRDLLHPGDHGEERA